jgi:hypothetical protein
VFGTRPSGVEPPEDPDTITLEEFRRARAAEDVRRAAAEARAGAERARRRAEDLAHARAEPAPEPERPFTSSWARWVPAAREDDDEGRPRRRARPEPELDVEGDGR